MDIFSNEIPKIRLEYYKILKSIVQLGSYRSPMKPWPNSTIAFMCIKGWIKRSDHSENIVVITSAGKFIYDHGVVQA